MFTAQFNLMNLKQLAKELNLSISAVSKALRDSHEIAEETKKRVRALALEIGYSPNPYAGFLRNQKSKTIALIAPELTNNFFIQAISGAESIAQEHDYHILVYTTNDDFEKEKSILFRPTFTHQSTNGHKHYAGCCANLPID